MINKSCPSAEAGVGGGGGLAAPPPPRVRTGMLALTLVPGWGQGLAARRHARPHPGPRLGPGASGRRTGRGAGL